MKKITFILAFLIAGLAYSQDRTCGMTQYMEEKMQDPEFAKEYLRTQELFKEELRKTLEEGVSYRGGTVVIPVAVHYPTGSEANRACLEALAQNQIDILNADYNGTNSDISLWGAASGNYPGVNTGSADFEFCLAVSNHPAGTDPDLVEGGPAVTIGYNFGGGGDADANWAGYMNFLVKPIGAGLLGYSPLGGSSAAGQSVVLNTNAFASGAGCPGFVPQPTYNLGRTTTHELGHFYNLNHTFTGSCGSDDGVADTPNIVDPNYGCPPAGSVAGCVGGESALTMSYMDYTNDACMYMFSAGQVARAQAYMNVLSTQFHTDRCEPAMVFDLDARVSINDLNLVECDLEITPEIELTNNGNNPLTSVTISYGINGATTDYDWTGNLASMGDSETINLPMLTGGAGSNSFVVELSDPNGGTDMNTSNDNDSEDFNASFNGSTSIELELTTDNWCEETTWEFRDSGGTILYSGGPYVQDVEDNTTFNESFAIENNECYTFTIFDAYADGICCDFGNGSYELRDNSGTLIFAGGAFGAEESTIITTAALSTTDFEFSNSLSIMPNPVSDVLTINTTDANLPDNFAIYNMLGQVMISRSISNESDLTINTSNYSNGMYFIRIMREGNSVSLPFVKK